MKPFGPNGHNAWTDVEILGWIEAKLAARDSAAWQPWPKMKSPPVATAASPKTFLLLRGMFATLPRRPARGKSRRLSHAANPGRHPLKDRGADLYETPPEATHALLRAEKLPKRIWEPACGRGAIVNVLREAGHEVVATDLVNYGAPITPPGYYGVDFAGAQGAGRLPSRRHESAIPARGAIRRARARPVPRVYMLLRLAFLESERRRGISRADARPRHVFRKSVPFMHRDNWAGPRASSSIAYAWFVFDRSHRGPTTIDRISWEKSNG